MQSAVLRSHVVCPSVCPSVCLSVTLVNCDDIGGKSSKKISPSVSLACSLFATQTSRVYSKGRETPWNSRPNRGGVLKKWLSAYKTSKSLKRGKIGPMLLLKSNRKSYTGFRLVPNQWPWMTLKGHYALCFKSRASFGAHCENLNEDRSILSATKM